MSGRLVTCIVPVFDGERYLAAALASILAQTHAPLDVIVADDGSTDGTAAIALAQGDRVRYLRQDNGGPASARNLGLSAARGEFVAFLDADDLWHPEKLARQLARFEARPELDCSVSHIQNFLDPELTGGSPGPVDPRITRPAPGYVTVTLLARRAVFDRVGPFDASLQHGDSTEWFLRAAEHGVVIELLPDLLVYRRLHLRNRSRLLGDSSRAAFLRIVKARLDRQRQGPAPAAPGAGPPVPERLR